MPSSRRARGEPIRFPFSGSYLHDGRPRPLPDRTDGFVRFVSTIRPSRGATWCDQGLIERLPQGSLGCRAQEIAMSERSPIHRRLAPFALAAVLIAALPVGGPDVAAAQTVGDVFQKVGPYVVV